MGQVGRSGSHEHPPDDSLCYDSPNTSLWLSKFKEDGTLKTSKNAHYLNKIGIDKSNRITKWEKLLNKTTQKTTQKAKKDAQYIIEDLQRKGLSERMTFRKKNSQVLQKIVCRNSSSKVLEKKIELEKPFSLKRSKSGLTLKRVLQRSSEK